MITTRNNKKAVAVILVFVLSFAVSFSTSAQSIIKPSEYICFQNDQIEYMSKDEFLNFIITQDNYSITNEFHEILKYQKMSDVELQKKGFSYRDIDNLKVIDIVGEVTRRQTLSDNDLYSLGMDNKQISALRAYDGTEESLMSISATLYASASVNGGVTYNSSTNKSTAKLSYYWSWSSTPWFSHTDIMAVGNTENFYINTSTSSARVLYAYSGSNAPYSSYWKTKSVTAIDSGLGAQSKFPVIDKVNYDSSDNPMPFYCSYGYMHAMVYRNGYSTNNIGMSGAYGHNQVILTPSVTLTINGMNVAIKFSFGVVKLGEALSFTQ